MWLKKAWERAKEQMPYGHNRNILSQITQISPQPLKTGQEKKMQLMQQETNLFKRLHALH